MLISWVELMHNKYHPAIEVHSCTSSGVSPIHVDVSGNRIEIIYDLPLGEIVFEGGKPLKIAMS